jgi:hypothetical protein
VLTLHGASLTAVSDAAPRPTGAEEAEEEAFEEAAEQGRALPNEDFTMVPRKLDARYEALDEDQCLRPTTVSCGPRWNKRSQRGLLGTPSTASLTEDAQTQERNKCFDLLCVPVPVPVPVPPRPPALTVSTPTRTPNADARQRTMH